MVGTPPAKVTPLALELLVQAGAVQPRAGHHQRAPTSGQA